MALGTAPRRVKPGVWVTMTGRTLTPDGGAYWENQYRTGHTDGKGHMRTPSVVQNAAVGGGVNAKAASRKPRPSSPTAAVTGIAADRGGGGGVSVGDFFQGAARVAYEGTPVAAVEHAARHPSLRSAVSALPVVGANFEAGVQTAEAGRSAGRRIAHGQAPSVGETLALASIFPFFGRGARLAKAATEAETAAKALPEADQVLKATGAARRTYAEQEALRSVERSRRAGQLEPSFEAAGGGVAGYHAGLARLKGELPSLRFDQLTHIDQAAMDKLLTVIQQHAELRPYEKLNLQAALLGVQEGKVPRPFEIKLIERAFGPDAATELAKTRPLSRKALQVAGEVLNLPRSILASFDVSAPFRQGLLSGAANPRIFAQNLGPMFRMLVSEKRYGQVMEEITQRPSYTTMLDAKLKLTDLGDLSTREEQFMSNLAEKITGGKRGVVRASSRAYTGFLNRMRADLFDHLVEVAREQGIETPKLRRDVARFVNVSTGRGELGPLEPAAVALNTVLFSPRLFASRINALNPVFYASLDPFARKQAVLAMTKLVGAGSTVLGLAALAGARVATDPRNSDFGKIRFGNTRIDIWGGHQQLARLFSQVATGEVVSSTTGKKLRLKGGYDLSKQDIVKRFLEGKLAPTPSLINDWFRGSDFADKPFSWKKAVLSRSYPLIVQDALSIYHDTGSPYKAIIGYGIGAFGVGVQNYGGSPPTSGGSGGGPVWGSDRGGGSFERQDTSGVWGGGKR